VEKQDEYPSDYAEDGGDKHGNDVDGDRRANEQVRQEKQDQSKDRVDYECQHVFISFFGLPTTLGRGSSKQPQ
jgi:hypothetical protein